MTGVNEDGIIRHFHQKIEGALLNRQALVLGTYSLKQSKMPYEGGQQGPACSIFIVYSTLQYYRIWHKHGRFQPLVLHPLDETSV